MTEEIIYFFRHHKFILNFFIIFFFIIFAILSSILLIYSNNVYQGGDMQFHLKRIIELNYSIKSGNILPDFAFNTFHGSAVMSLYPYLNLLPLAFLSFIIKSKVILIYSFFIFNTLLTFIISFFTSKNYSKSYLISFLFSVIYSLSNIFLGYNLSMFDFGIVSTVTFLPLVIFNFLNILQGKNNWIGLSIGIILISFSHILNIFIVSFFLLLWLIINIKKINESILIKLFKSSLLFIVISSIIWIPFLHIYITNFHNINMPSIIKLSNINIKDFLSGIYGKKSNNTIGSFAILNIFIAPFFYRKFNKYIKQMYWLSLLIIFSVMFLPWNLITSYNFFTFLNIFQRLFRLLIIPQFLLSYIFSVIISKYIRQIKLKIILYFMTILITLILQLGGQYSFINKNYLPIDSYLKKNNNIIDNGIFSVMKYKFSNVKQFNKLINSYQDTNNDYIPKSSISISKYVNKNLGLYNNHYRIIVKHVGYNQFDFVNKKNIYKLYLPIYVYNKEKLHVYLNGKEVNNYTNKNGLLAVNNIQHNMKSNNKIYIKPFPNLYRIIGTVLSILGWLFVLCIIIRRKLLH